MLILPEADSDLKKLIEFSSNNDPTEKYRELWGKEYKVLAQELWGKSTYAFLVKKPLNYSINELLLCMAFDIAVAPYIGIPQDISHKYLLYLLQELRDSVGDTVNLPPV